MNRTTDLPHWAGVLSAGPCFSFAHWPNPKVPRDKAGVYTLWLDWHEFAYAGMAGRSIHENGSSQKGGLFGRLNAHANGARSGNRFCIYVADRMVIPTLTPEDLKAIGEGRLLLDDLTGEFIRSRMSYTKGPDR